MITIADRDVMIKQRFKEGDSLGDIAVDFALSSQRVWQIMRGKGKQPLTR